MRTSLNNLQEIELYLFQRSPAADRLVFEARMLIDDELTQNVSLQQDTYALIRQYGRRQLKAELEDVHRQLFTQLRHQSFRQKIMALFK